jgi:hypothetical protein
MDWRAGHARHTRRISVALCAAFLALAAFTGTAPAVSRPTLGNDTQREVYGFFGPGNRGAEIAAKGVDGVEPYYDDTASMAIKYDLVNAQGLRGVGIWHLNYGADRTDFYAQLKVEFGP